VRKNAIIPPMIAKHAIPPTTPPTIAPIGVLLFVFDCDGVDVDVDVDAEVFLPPPFVLDDGVDIVLRTEEVVVVWVEVDVFSGKS
jgi:hypothetical protein